MGKKRQVVIGQKYYMLVSHHRLTYHCRDNIKSTFSPSTGIERKSGTVQQSNRLTSCRRPTLVPSNFQRISNYQGSVALSALTHSANIIFIILGCACVCSRDGRYFPPLRRVPCARSVMISQRTVL